MFKKVNNFHEDLPFPPVKLKEINNGNSKEVLDVTIHTVAIAPEDHKDVDGWLFPLFKKIEKVFVNRHGRYWPERVAMTSPIIREIRGDYKDKKLMVTIITVDVSPVIKAEGLYDQR